MGNSAEGEGRGGEGGGGGWRGEEGKEDLSRPQFLSQRQALTRSMSGSAYSMESKDCEGGREGERRGELSGGEQGGRGGRGGGYHVRCIHVAHTEWEGGNAGAVA